MGQDPYYNIPGYLILKEQQTIVKQSKKYLSADPEDIISPSGDQEHLIKFYKNKQKVFTEDAYIYITCFHVHFCIFIFHNQLYILFQYNLN